MVNQKLVEFIVFRTAVHTDGERLGLCTGVAVTVYASIVTTVVAMELIHTER